ncbi:MAG: hypothetical protein JO142_08020 [Burkholderiales bacterium]|nr:hypothetical protein [Burkholderiales bacterium]
MITALLDGNVYDKLAIDDTTRNHLAQLIHQGRIKVVVPRTIQEELYASPFRGIPTFFPCELRGNTVGAAGVMRAGDSIGAGQVFYKHLGTSQKVSDALIADAANWGVSWLVSCDGRLIHRMALTNAQCRAMSYEQMVAELMALSAPSGTGPDDTTTHSR